MDRPEASITEETANRQEVAIPPAVLKHRQFPVTGGCRPDELLSVSARQGERLVDDHLALRRECSVRRDL